MYLVEFPIEMVVIVLSSASITTVFSPMFRNIPANVVAAAWLLPDGPRPCGPPCGYRRPGYPPPGYPTPGMMIWPKPGAPASRRTVSKDVNPRAIDPLDEG